MTTLNQNNDMVWAEVMASRVRRAYIGKHVSRALATTGVACALLVGIFVWQSAESPTVDAETTAAFILTQVEETYSAVYSSTQDVGVDDIDIFTL
jgi:hypothetical protein